MLIWLSKFHFFKFLLFIDLGIYSAQAKVCLCAVTVRRAKSTLLFDLG